MLDSDVSYFLDATLVLGNNVIDGPKLSTVAFLLLSEVFGVIAVSNLLGLISCVVDRNEDDKSLVKPR